MKSSIGLGEPPRSICTNSENLRCSQTKIGSIEGSRKKLRYVFVFAVISREKEKHFSHEIFDFLAQKGAMNFYARIFANFYSKKLTQTSFQAWIS